MKKKLIVLVVGIIILVGGFFLLGSNVGTQKPASDGKPAVDNESTLADDTKNWKTSVGDGLTFMYPAEPGTSYIVPKVWPPQAFILGINGPLACAASGSASSTTGMTSSKTINGHTYCVTVKPIGTGNTASTQYAYVFEKDKKIVALIFGLRYIPCTNYPDTKKAVCESERKTFNIDNTADKMAQTFKLGALQAPSTSTIPKGQ